MRSRPSWRRNIRKTDDGQPLRLIHPGLYGDDGDVIRGFLYSVTAGSAGAGGGMRESGQLCLRRARRIAAGNWRSVWPSDRAGGGWCGNSLTEAMVLSLLGGAAGLVIADLLLGVAEPVGISPLAIWQSAWMRVSIWQAWS